jgi:ribosomal protein S18 acetylase RimI-like enzyme
MIVRTARESDAARIAELHTKSWRIAYKDVLSQKYLAEDIESDRLTTWTNRLSGPSASQIILAAEEDSRFLGFACVYLDHDAEWGALLDNLHVQPELKGNGIDRVLMHEVVRHCERQTSLHLWVLECNVAAQAFYKKLGALHSGNGVWNPPGGGVANKFLYTWKVPIVLAK